LAEFFGSSIGSSLGSSYGSSPCGNLLDFACSFRGAVWSAGLNSAESLDFACKTLPIKQGIEWARRGFERVCNKVTEEDKPLLGCGSVSETILFVRIV
jgi:hypothetical protein